MYKAIGSCVLSELSRKKAVTSLCLYTSMLSSSFRPQKQQTCCLHTQSRLNNVVNPKQHKSQLTIYEDRNLPRTKRFKRILPAIILEKFWKGHEVDEAMQYLYEDLCDEVDYLKFFRDFNMSDTFASWFVVMELHIYLLCCRFMREGHEVGIPIRDSLTDLFWQDVQFRAERLGPIPQSDRMKSLRILSNQFQAAFYSYDEGMQTNDIILAGAIWRRFFGLECDDASQIERLVKYMRLQMQSLDEDSLEEVLFKARKYFIPLIEVTVE